MNAAAAVDPTTPPEGDPAADLVIVTVVYASQAPLEQLAIDLARQHPRPARWLVVDNAPRTAPLRLSPALTAVPAERIEGEEGAGFGEGCNRAFAHLAADGWDGWVWLLNPDTGLAEADLLGRLSTLLARQPERALLGTAVRSADGALEASGGWIDPGLAFRRRRIGDRFLEQARPAPLALDWLSGCSLALRPTAHRPAARFDAALPLYYEDMDLCLRLRQAGAPVLWSSAVAIEHRRGGGSGGDPERRLRLTTLSYWRFLQRHSPGWVRWLRGGRLLATALVRLPLAPGRSVAVLRGLVAALRDPIGRGPA